MPQIAMASSDPSNLLGQPLSPPPPGVTSNFAHPKSRAFVVYVAAGICLPFVVVFAGLRFYAKATIQKKIRRDDVTCIFGVLAGISYIATVVAAISGGAYGFHQWDITIADFTKSQLLLTLVNEAIYGPCIWFIKLALFVLYLEVFGLLKWFRYLVLTGAFVTGVFYFATLVSLIASCSPTNGQSQFSYLSSLAGPRCQRTTRPLTIAIGVVNVVSDLYLILIPLPPVWSLQLPLRRKIGLSAMFLTGSIACAASILGMVFRVQQNRSTDNTWVVINVWTTSIIEIAAGIVVCCMPTTAAVFKKLKSPLSSLLATYRRGVRVHFSSSAAIQHEQASSSANLRSIYGDHSHQRAYEIHGNAQKSWSGSTNPRTEYLQESETASTFPLENTTIRKTTEIDVSKSSVGS